MEIKGNEFLEKVQKIQNGKNKEEESELSDLLLSSHEGKSDKKKYAILGILLIILFLVTIVLIRLISNAKVSNENLSNKTVQQQKQNDAIDKKYQQIINKDLSIKNNKKVMKEPNIKSAQKAQDSKTSGTYNPSNKNKAYRQKIQQKNKGIAGEIRRTFQNMKTSSSSKKYANTYPKAFYIQVGAYTNMPSKQILGNIKKLGLQYKIFKKSINGVVFNKLLIGPYFSRTKAEAKLGKVKTSLKAPHAYLTQI